MSTPYIQTKNTPGFAETGYKVGIVESDRRFLMLNYAELLKLRDRINQIEAAHDAKEGTHNDRSA